MSEDRDTMARRVRRRISLSDRFEMYVYRDWGSDACWPWLGTIATNGYGKIYGGPDSPMRMLSAARVSWELANGRPIPEGKLIRHSCDHRDCCNYRHLEPGTHEENTTEMWARGRGRGGIEPSPPLLTKEQRRAILKARQVPKIISVEMQKKIARRLVNDAVREGMLTRPEACSGCGEIPARGSDGRTCVHAHHHNGYADPLDVIWLCVRCHLAEDRRPSGEDSGRAKLKAEEAIKIFYDTRPRSEIARSFGIGKSQVSRIKKRESWKDLTAGIA